MEEYLIDRETLGKFVDELIKKKALPVDNVEELNQLREKSIRELDDKIGRNLFGKLNREQNAEINELFDKNEESPEVFKDFFQRAGIDVENVITESVQEFAKDFLGGESDE